MENNELLHFHSDTELSLEESSGELGQESGSSQGDKHLPCNGLYAEELPKQGQSSLLCLFWAVLHGKSQNGCCRWFLLPLTLSPHA